MPTAAQGNSKSTTYKEALLSTCIRYQLARTSRSMPYLVFDLNAGSGVNQIDGRRLRGSSLIARDSMVENQRGGYVFACDKSRQAIEDLRQRIVLTPYLFPGFQSVNIKLFRKDNEKFVSEIPTIIRNEVDTDKWTRGIIIADPNGLHVPLKAIASVVEGYRYMDVWIHLGAFDHVWREQANNPRRPGMPFALSERSVPSLDAIFTAIKKDYWLLTERFGSGRGHIVLFGSNMKLEPYAGNGRPALYRLDSPDGQRIVGKYRRPNASTSIG